MKKLRNLLLTLSFLLLITAASCVTAFAASTDPVTIPDNHLRNALLTKLNKAEGDVITEEEMASFEILEIPNSSIVSLKGLEYCTSLRLLDLTNNKVNGIDAIKNLTELRYAKL